MVSSNSYEIRATVFEYSNTSIPEGMYIYERKYTFHS